MEALRVESYEIARCLIEDRETSLFVLKVKEFIARRAWRNALATEDLSLLTSPGRVFASDALSRLHRRALKRGKNLPDVPDEERHERMMYQHIHNLRSNHAAVQTEPARVRDGC